MGIPTPLPGSTRSLAGPAARMAALLSLVVLASACDVRSGAWGDVNSVIVAASPEVWEQIEDTVASALEPTILTTRDERTFKVTWQDPGGEYWGNLQRFRQMLLVGSPGDAWVDPALEAVRGEVPAPPAMFQVNDVWARNQTVTVLLVPREAPAEAATGMLEELHQLLDTQFRDYAIQRMYMSGLDSALADTLFREAGFYLLVPQVYRWGATDSVYVFRNDNPDPAELIRQVTVTWRTPVPQGIQPEELLEWRRRLAEEYYAYPQVEDLSLVEAGPTEYRGMDAYQIQSVWSNPPGSDWPAGGPFILRSVVCPNQERLYFVDAWLYAPGKDKYEYMIQLQTILDTFRCGSF